MDRVRDEGATDDASDDEGVVGVLGGMGPAATVNFMEELVTATPAEGDADHLETVVYNDAKIPDRNAAILDDGESPVPRLVRDARRLESIGADFLAMPCNTAHYYYETIAAAVDVEVLHMIELTRERLAATGAGRAGLLATSTVMETGVYHSAFGDSAVEIVYPDAVDRLMDAIYAVKEDRPDAAERLVEEVVEGLLAKDVDAVVIGCTELSTLPIECEPAAVDPTALLAAECVERARSCSVGLASGE